MNILIVHNRYQIPGGEDVSTTQQVALLRSGGHTVDLFEDSNDRIEVIGRARTAIRSVWSTEAHAEVTRRLTEGQFDVMHVQNLFPLHSPSVLYAAHALGVPTVMSLRNFRLVCPQGMLFRGGGICMECIGRPIAWPAIKYRCYRDSAAGSAVVATMTAGHRVAGTWRDAVDLFVAPSEFAAAVFIADGWDPDHIEVAPNFVHPDPGPGTGDGDYVLFAGRLTPEKGVRLILEAWRRELSHIPLRIVGGGAERNAVVAAAEDIDSIEYLGYRSTDEVSDLMAGARFVICPTVGVETFGRVALEAHARGTPVVASNMGGLAEIVERGHTGLLFEVGDHDSFVEAVTELWDAPATTRSMRAPARDRYLSHFASARSLDRWERLYRLAAERHRT